MRVSRRFFLWGGTAALALLIVGRRAWQTAKVRIFGKLKEDEFPVRQLPAEALKSEQFVGDNPDRAHEILWRKKEIFRLPGVISERAPLVVVGGGMSGLASAYWLRDRNPLILEQASQLGGNSRGEIWGDCRFSWAAAYMGPPDKGTPSFDLLHALGLENEGRIEQGIGATFFGGRPHENFWSGATDLRNAAAFRNAEMILKDIFSKSYPEIPFRENGTLSKDDFESLDRESLRQWCERELVPFPGHIQKFIDGYCYSSFGGGSAEVSAAQGLSFLSSDLTAIRVFPGGNSRISDVLVRKLESVLPEGHLRTQTLVADVKIENEGVRVTYRNPDGTFESILAEQCIMACPKFVAAKVMDDLPSDQRDAIQRLKYRAYAVVNIILKKKVPSPGYDLFNLDHVLGVDERRPDLPFVDSIFASWAQEDRCENSVITLYRPFPYEGARPQLLTKTFRMFEDETRKAIQPLLAVLSLENSDIEGLRISRFGHAMPLAAPGLLADGICERAHRPIQNKIFFAHQDNWANPSFETATKVAWEVSQRMGSL